MGLCYFQSVVRLLMEAMCIFVAYWHYFLSLIAYWEFLGFSRTSWERK